MTNLTQLRDTFQERITVVIADDHQLARQGLARAIKRHPGLELIGEAPDGPTALAAIEALAPDVALIDVRMPGLDGVEVCERLIEREPNCHTRVVLLTAYPNNRLRDRALGAGAVAFLDKAASRQELCDALIAAASN